MALLKGTLDVLVLKALSFGPLHGFEITRWIEDGSGGEFTIESAALLQALGGGWWHDARPSAAAAPAPETDPAAPAR